MVGPTIVGPRVVGRGVVAQVQYFEVRDLDAGGIEFIGVRRRGGIRLLCDDRLENAVGARFEFERRFSRGETARILGQSRQGVEHFAAPSAAHLAAGGAQRFRRQLEYGLAF